jgi:hypothetical protein
MGRGKGIGIGETQGQGIKVGKITFLISEGTTSRITKTVICPDFYHSG